MAVYDIVLISLSNRIPVAEVEAMRDDSDEDDAETAADETSEVSS